MHNAFRREGGVIGDRWILSAGAFCGFARPTYQARSVSEETVDTPRLRFGLVPRLRFGLVPRLRFGLVPRLRFGLVPRLRFGLVPRLRFGLVPRLRFGLV